MKEAVNEEHEGKRKCELTWKVHRIHWEKNRFIYDLMYVRKVMSRELVRSSLAKLPHQACCSPELPCQPCRTLSCLLIVFTYMQFDWLVRNKIADGALIAKWRKPGYEILCSLLAIQKGNHNFGTTSHCR